MNSDKKNKEQDKTFQIELNQNFGKMKKCINCKKLLPIENFHNDKKYKGGYKNQCRKCILDKKRSQLKKPLLTDERLKKIIALAKKREANEKIIKDGLKICNLCNRKLQFSEFSKNKGKSGGVSDECRDCVSKRGAARYKSDSGFNARLRLKEIRRRSMNGKLPCNIDVEFLENQFNEQHGLCFYSKLPMTKEIGKSNTASIDRIQPSKGYTKDNVVLCCDSINGMKNSMSYETLFELCKQIVDNKIPFTDNLKKFPEEKYWRVKASDNWKDSEFSKMDIRIDGLHTARQP